MDRMPGNDPMENPPPLAGLDPAELLKQGAADDTLIEGAPASFNPPPVEKLAAIFPQFEILELIGQGGMGAVYKVRQKDLDRIVALKILPPGIGQSPEFSSRFTREARALAKLNHPGIVTLHEFGQQDGLYFILMEFVDGVNLAQLMKTGRVSPREALAIVPQICDALQYAHDQGIVHRDIKPENILLDRSGRVKVADFGIAKVVASVCDRRTDEDDEVRRSQTDATLAGKIIGTPQYMAPEQLEHPSDVDHRADIYALGVVFYQMLTGELPGKDLQAPSRKLQIDVRLDEIVLKAMEKAPEVRYQTVGILKTQLESIVSEMGSAAVPAASLDVPWNKRPESGVPLESRFSRTAIVGACWAPLFFVFLFFWFSPGTVVVVPPGGKAPEPTFWQMLLRFTLLPLGLTSPLGTTILGWISFSQIRRSAGKLHGMWLAVLDGLLFPLLILTGLIGWFWHWVFYDLIRATIIAGQPELSTLEQLIVNNTTPFTLLATLVSSLVAGFIITRMVWRAVNTSSSAALKQPSPGRNSAVKTIAIGCGVLVMIGVVVVVLMVIAFVMVQPRKMENPAEKPTVTDDRGGRTADSATSEQTSGIPPEKKLAEYDWKTLSAEGRLGAGVPVTRDGRSCLKIENPADKPMQARLLTIENPPIEAMRYAVSGEVSHENIQGAAYLEMWSVFPKGRYFSRTLGEPGSGPMGKLTGTSDWREFSLPFDRKGTDDAPDRIEVNLHLPGKGVVFLSPLEFIEFIPDGEAGEHPGIASKVPKKDADIEKATEAATAWLASIDAGEYGRSWNEAAVFFRNSVTEAGWSELMFALRQPLGGVKSRVLVKHENANALPGAPDGKYVVMQFEASFSRKKMAMETVTITREEDGSWKAAGYFIR